MKILYFSGIISDILEYIILVFTVDDHFVFFAVYQEAGRGFLGPLADDPQQYSLTPCKNPACY